MKPDPSVLDEAVRAHHAAGRSRLTLKVRGFSRDEVAARWRALTEGVTAPVVRIGRKPGLDPAEDGLMRLRRKQQLTVDQLRQAFAYRDDAALAALAVGPVKVSDLEGARGGGGGKAACASDGGLADYIAAQRRQFTRRNVVLSGQSDMLTVMDGVCVGRHTLMALAGEDDRRSRELLAVLRVALDLLHIAAGGRATKAA